MPHGKPDRWNPTRRLLWYVNDTVLVVCRFVLLAGCAAPHVRLHQRPENATNRTNLQYRLHTALRVAPADHLLCHRARRGPKASLLHAVSRRIVVCNSQVGNNGLRINLERASISWYVVYDSLIQYISKNVFC